MIKNLLKLILPLKFRAYLSHFKQSLTIGFKQCCSRNRFLSRIYYCFFNSSFSRENQSVLVGMLEYNKRLQNVGKSSALLRRNTHRLEKGLIMEPRREIFGADYIEETIKCYETCLSTDSITKQELKWAFDVLSDYFRVVNYKNNSRCNAAFMKFHELKDESYKLLEEILSDEKFVPYRKEDACKSDITFEELTTLFKQRRSVRWYTDEKVSRNLIEKAVNIATYAPSACNRQPFRFHFIDKKNDVLEVADLAMGTRGFSDNLAAIFVITGDLSAYPYERDRHVIYIDASLAAMQLMLALETLGLSSCPINWPDIEFREEAMQKKLNLGMEERPIMLLSVGYAKPTGKIPYSQKKNASLLLNYFN